MSTAGNSINPHSGNPRGKRGRGGFTLFELVVVITVLGVMVGLLVPNLSFDTGKNGIEAVVRTVQNGLNQGRAMARLHRTSVDVVFGATGMQVGEDGDRLKYPDDARYIKIVRPEPDAPVSDKLVVDRRGIIPVSIVVMKLDDETFSLRVPPVMRQVEYRMGMADFEDFAD